MTRALVRLATVVALIASALLLPTTGSTPADSASAADLSYFDPANIISDAVFFDRWSMDVNAVQAFLNTKGAKCVPGEAPCLKDYSQPTADQAGDAYCATYPGAPRGESAAWIIVKVSQACGINPRALLVLLQKEQGLITGSKRAASAYSNATGFACPDTSPCNPAFSGFASQVYFAARQFQRYAAGAAGSYRAGRNNTVYYNPNKACGSSQVYIQNAATAGLYSYTPYQPNAAALAAGYGEGDGCSAYGNRNFWNYFTDWFGSTQSTGGGAIYTEYQDLGGSSGRLGPATAGFVCGLVNGGCFQHFQNGSIYWTPGTGAQPVLGEIRSRWAALGWERSPLGYPVSDEFCGLVSGGCFQAYQGGSMYWSPATGAQFVTGPVRDAWGVTGWESGWLGYPVTDQVCGLRNGGCTNHFEHGTIYWSPSTGAHPSNPQILSKWVPLGMENGLLGYPTTDVVCGSDRGGCLQGFEGGAVYWTDVTGAHFVRGQIQIAWGVTGWQSGWLGYPISDEVCGLQGGGCSTDFEGGSIYWTGATGAHAVTGPIRDAWRAGGRETGPWGYPVGDAIANGDLVTQRFQGGTATWNTRTGSVTI